MHTIKPPNTATSLATLLLSLSATRNIPKTQQLHSHLLKSGFIPSSNPSIPLLSNHLITIYAKCHFPFLSLQAFLDNHYKPPSSWSSLIASLAQNEQHSLSLSTFRDMLCRGLCPTDHTYPSGFKSCAALNVPDAGMCVQCLVVKTGFWDDVYVGSSIVDMYAKCGLMDSARKVFDEMPYKNVVSWSGLIHGYAQMGFDNEAVRLFKCALENGVRPNDFTFSCVVRVCGLLTLLEFGCQVHGLCVKSSYDSSPFVGSSLITLYSKCGLVEYSYNVFNEMHDRNLGAWNAILIASAQHGHMEVAFERTCPRRKEIFCNDAEL